MTLTAEVELWSHGVMIHSVGEWCLVGSCAVAVIFTTTMGAKAKSKREVECNVIYLLRKWFLVSVNGEGSYIYIQESFRRTESYL